MRKAHHTLLLLFLEEFCHYQHPTALEQTVQSDQYCWLNKKTAISRKYLTVLT